MRERQLSKYEFHAYATCFRRFYTESGIKVSRSEETKKGINKLYTQFNELERLFNFVGINTRTLNGFNESITG